MNKIIQTKWLIFVILAFLIVGIVYVYDPFSSKSGWPTSIYSESYPDTGLLRINPETILASLDQGNMDVFLPDTRTLDDRVSGPILDNNPILWSQSDNLKIITALNNFVWKDTLDNWSLFIMAFNTACQDNPSGLPGGDFQYFKASLENGKMINTWREMEINPEYLNVAWGGDAKFAHPPLGLKSIDLTQLKVTAEDAIKIAEAHGGRESRMKVQNQCYIHLFLMPERFKGWKVDYGYSAGFEIQINPYTGEIIK
jgi:hypothetical protein